MAAIVVASVAAIAVFLVAFYLLGIVPAARRALGTTQSAMATMRDPAMDELARERAVQSAALGLIGLSVSLLLRSLAALAAAAVPILLFDLLGLAPWQATTAFLGRVDVIVVSSVVIVVGWLLAVRLWKR